MVIVSYLVKFLEKKMKKFNIRVFLFQHNPNVTFNEVSRKKMKILRIRLFIFNT